MNRWWKAPRQPARGRLKEKRVKIEIEGKKYKVIEDVSVPGLRAKAVETALGERIAVIKNGKWSWWTVNDRLGIK